MVHLGDLHHRGRPQLLLAPPIGAQRPGAVGRAPAAPFRQDLQPHGEHPQRLVHHLVQAHLLDVVALGRL